MNGLDLVSGKVTIELIEFLGVGWLMVEREGPGLTDFWRGRKPARRELELPVGMLDHRDRRMNGDDGDFHPVRRF